MARGKTTEVRPPRPDERPLFRPDPGASPAPAPLRQGTGSGHRDDRSAPGPGWVWQGMRRITSTCSPTWSRSTRTSATRSSRSPASTHLRHLVESSGKTRATVAAEAGLPESTLSEVLLGRRRLNTRHIGILARYFRIDPGVFLDAPAE